MLLSVYFGGIRGVLATGNNKYNVISCCINSRQTNIQASGKSSLKLLMRQNTHLSSIRGLLK